MKITHWIVASCLVVLVLAVIPTMQATTNCTFFLSPAGTADPKTCGSSTTPCLTLAAISSALNNKTQPNCSYQKLNQVDLTIIATAGIYEDAANRAILFSGLNAFTLQSQTLNNEDVVFDADSLDRSLHIDSVPSIAINAVTFRHGNSDSDGNGGCLLITGPKAIVSIDSVSFNNCSALSSTPSTSPSVGGCFAMDQKTVPLLSQPTKLSVSNSQFSLCTSNNGGALSVGGGAFASVQNSTFSSNKAVAVAVSEAASPSYAGFGGAIFSQGLNFTLSFSSFDSNVADASGGALYVSKASPSSFSVSSFKLNSAALGGALVVLSSPTSTFQSLDFQQNSASLDGGALVISVQDGDPYSVATMDNITFYGNKASTGNGGALYLLGPYNTVLLSNVTATSNTAGQYGGVFYTNNTNEFRITEALISQNSAAVAGGAFGCFRSADSTVVNATLIDNASGLTKYSDVYSVEDSCSSLLYQLCPCGTDFPYANTNTSSTDCASAFCPYGTCASHSDSVDDEGSCFCFYQPACQQWSSDAPKGLDLQWLYITVGCIVAFVIFILFVGSMLLFRNWKAKTSGGYKLADPSQQQGEGEGEEDPLF